MSGLGNSLQGRLSLRDECLFPLRYLPELCCRPYVWDNAAADERVQMPAAPAGPWVPNGILRPVCVRNSMQSVLGDEDETVSGR